MKMSLSVLLEAARYVERQDELKAQRQIENNNGQTQSMIHHHQQQQQQQQHNHQLAPPPLQTRPVSPSYSLLKQELTATLPPPLASPTTSPATIVTTTTPSSRVINNSFDIINPIVTDEGGEQKRKQPPLAFRSGTREVHNKLEKHRRAHLKECFDLLKRQLPVYAHEKKASNLSILHSALCYIQSLKRRERDLEHEMERLAREKIAHQQKLVGLKKEVAAQCDNVDFAALLDVTTASVPALQSSSITSSSTVSYQQQQEQQQLVALENNFNCKLTTVVDRASKMMTAVMPSAVELQKLTTTRPSSVVATPPLTTSSTTATAQRTVVPVTVNGMKEGNQMQTTTLSVVPVGYPVSQGLVLQKVLVPKSLTDLSPLVPAPTVAHFIAASPQIGGKVVPLVNAQYVVKPVVVVSTPSRPS